MTWLLKHFGFLILFCTPFFLHKDHADSPAELPKMLYSALLIIIYFILWLIYFLKSKTLVFRWNSVLTLLTAIVLGVMVSYLFTVAPYLSFWGERALPSDSVLSILMFYLLAILMTQFFDPKKDFIKLYVLYAALLIIQIAISINQRHAFVLTWFSRESVFGTIGVTVGYATFVGCLIPIIITRLLTCAKKIEVYALLGLLFLTKLTMLYASSRMPNVVNILITLLIIAVIFYIQRKFEVIKRGLLILLTFTAAYTYFKYDVVSPELNQKFQQNMLDKAISSRMLVWKSAIDVWKKSPLIGTGPETFLVLERPLQDIRINKYEYWNQGWPKVHNHILQILACTGIFGLLTHLALLFYMSFRTLQGIIHRQTDSETHFGRALYFSYLFLFISNVTCFNFISTQMLTFVFPALFGLTWGTRPYFEIKISLPHRLKILVFILFTLPTTALAIQIYHYTMSNIYHQWGLRESKKEKQYLRAVDYYYKGLEHNEKEPFLYCQLAYAYAGMLENNSLAERAAQNTSQKIKIALLSPSDKAKALQIIEENIKSCLDLGEKRSHFYMVVANLYGRMFYDGTTGPEKAIEAYQFLIGYLPNNPENHLMLGVIYLRNSQEDLFIQSMRRAIELKQDYIPPYIELLNYYYRTGKYDEVPALLDDVDKIYFHTEHNITYIYDLIELADKARDLYAKQRLFKKYTLERKKFNLN